MIRILTVTNNHPELNGCHLIKTDCLSSAVIRSIFISTKKDISDTKNYIPWLEKYGDRIYDLMLTNTENIIALNKAILNGQTEQRKITQSELIAFGL